MFHQCNLSHDSTIQAFVAEEQSIQAFEARASEASQKAQRFGFNLGIFSGLSALGINGAMAVVLYLGKSLYNISSEDAMAIAFSTIKIQTSLAQLSTLVPQLVSCKAAWDRLGDIIDAPPEQNAPEYQHLKPRVQGEICFKNVNFKYWNKNENALNDFNLQVKPGQVVALVGSNGSGKSTVTKLLLRFFELYDGTLTIDGVNVKHMDRAWLRENIGIVEQDFRFFPGTIRDNIAMGCQAASDEEIRAVAKRAGCHDFISELPNGYETQVGWGSNQLSGGQRQKIAIARAMLKKPRILILDEATSALDANSEAEITNTLTDLMRGRTTVVIAHRLSIVQACDHIVVLSHGDIVEQGTHADLMAKHGFYANLVAMQKKEDK